MRAYEFRVVVAADPSAYDRLEEALQESGVDDAYVGATDATLHVDFERQGKSMTAAILTAIRDVREAGFEIARLDTDELVTAAEIARRAGRTRESVRLLASGSRGPGGFPPPVGRHLRSRQWRWSEVAPWLERAGLLEPGHSEEAAAIAAVNGAIDLVRNAPSPHNRREIMTALQA